MTLINLPLDGAIALFTLWLYYTYEFLLKKTIEQNKGEIFKEISVLTEKMLKEYNKSKNDALLVKIIDLNSFKKDIDASSEKFQGVFIFTIALLFCLGIVYALNAFNFVNTGSATVNSTNATSLSTNAVSNDHLSQSSDITGAQTIFVVGFIIFMILFLDRFSTLYTTASIINKHKSGHPLDELLKREE